MVRCAKTSYVITYGYDALSRQTSVTDPLTNTVTTAYDAEGRVVSQRGATYPVDYSYDEFGDKISMTTYRDINAAGDVTRWLRDVATGLVTNKVYADGKGPRYAYTPDGKLATRTWARGIVTTYSYDANGALTNTVYSDGTPTISIVYNRAGRQVRAEDAAGVMTFLYDDFGEVTNETVIGVAGTNTIERYYDSFGRSLGYALNGVRQSTLAYDPATGRLATMLANGCDTPFTWNYLAGSDLKSSLAYPNGLTASWQYDANGQLLHVKNAFPTNTISQYDYTYDAAGRRISVSKSGSAFDQDDTIAYGYNARSELTNAVAAVDSDYRYAYDFDDIGNRETSSERGTNSVYTANNLNQYTAVDDFVPQFDDDGNQTLIKTETGIWSVTYNGENRPILWENVSTNSSALNSSTPTLITMSYDRMGRRMTKNAQRFVYDGYLQIANFEHSTSNIELQTFIWDPTEPVATRPLVWNRDTSSEYYSHDGNKNVSEVVATDGVTCAHYEYAPFGAELVMHGEEAQSNPWRFSSEYAEDDSATIYYNYRHYEPIAGRWMRRDLVENDISANLYAICGNVAIDKFDLLGLVSIVYRSSLPDHQKGGDVKDVKNEISSYQDVKIYETLSSESNVWGQFEAELHFGKNSCNIIIYLSIRLQELAENESDVVYSVFPHYVDKNELKGGGTKILKKNGQLYPGGVALKGALLAHERGHARSFFEDQKELFIRKISPYIRKVKLSPDDKVAIIKAFDEAREETLDATARKSFEDERQWYEANGFNERQNGKRYEYSK